MGLPPLISTFGDIAVGKHGRFQPHLSLEVATFQNVWVIRRDRHDNFAPSLGVLSVNGWSDGETSEQKQCRQPANLGQHSN